MSNTDFKAPNETKALNATLQELGVDIDLREQKIHGDTMQTVRVCWHPWMPISMLSSNGTKFNIPAPRPPRRPYFERLSPIILPAFPAQNILPRKAPYGFLGNLVSSDPRLPSEGGDGFGLAVTSGAVGSHVEQITQMPRTSVDALVTAYGKFGLVELESLASEGAQELRQRILLYRGIFETDFTDDEENSVRATDLILEAWPSWLASEAERALKRAIDHGVAVAGEIARLPKSFARIGEQLISEVSFGIARAEDMALNESSGVLPLTKTAMEAKEKRSYDKLDFFLLEQYPSFEMDTDIERAARANTEAMKEAGKGSEQIGTAVLEMAKQNTAILQELAESRKMMMQMMRAFTQNANAQATNP